MLISFRNTTKLLEFYYYGSVVGVKGSVRSHFVHKTICNNLFKWFKFSHNSPSFRWRCFSRRNTLTVHESDETLRLIRFKQPYLKLLTYLNVGIEMLPPTGTIQKTLIQIDEFLIMSTTKPTNLKKGTKKHLFDSPLK